MLIRYPRRFQNAKRERKPVDWTLKALYIYIYAYTKAMALLRITRRIILKALAPSSMVFVVSICLEDRNVFARIDEIPSMTL